MTTMPETEKQTSGQPDASGLRPARIGRWEMPEIHTMPKRFINSTPARAADKPSHHGLLILVVGVVILLAAFAGLYIYLSRAAKTTVPAPAAAPETDAAATDEPGAVTNLPAPAAPETDPDSEPEPAAAETPSVAPAVPATPEEIEAAISGPDNANATSAPRVYTAASDGDGDGLGDSEELAIDTNPAVRDSDGDGYDDKAELMNLYNPAGAGKLVVNPNIKKYTNAGYAYSLYHPVSFTAESVGGDESVMFRTGNNQFIQVIVQPNREQQSIADWYKATFGAGFTTAEQQVFKSGWTGIRSLDGLTYYLKSAKRPEIITVAYNAGLETVLYQRQLFEVMVKSLEIAN